MNLQGTGVKFFKGIRCESGIVQGVQKKGDRTDAAINSLVNS